ncbi:MULTISPECIES: amidohydrolase [unclassified Ornithinimicrobium]|uniref:amidohydrolase n=1 Tax=unclassified Ornithinimicrobium TaxID=2615080 RepID=UPI003851F2E3
MTDELAEQILQWHKWLDQHPERAWQEQVTTAYLVHQLESMGARCHQLEGRTGAIVELGAGPRWVALRADLDAIWMGGEDGYAVHSCGHSAHMAIVLGAVHLLTQADLPEGVGVRVLLQPAEEPGTGALDLIRRGALEGVSHLFGLHLRPADELGSGDFAPALHSGASETGLVTVVGQDAHGARPHQGCNAIDPLVALHQVLPTLRFAPGESYSAKITRIRAGGGSTNVIPGRAECAIDLRSQRNEVLRSLRERITAAAAGIALTYDVEIAIEWCEDTPGAEVHPEAAEIFAWAIRDVAGEEHLAPEIVTPGADDFHHYSQGRPELRSAMLAVGVGLRPGLHHPDVTYDTAPLLTAAEIMARAVLLAAQPPLHI